MIKVSSFKTDRMAELFDRLFRQKWVHLLFNTFVFVLLSWVLPIRFEENDDIAMCMIANGIYSGSPDCHLVFINAILGSFIAMLYKLYSGVEWYTMFFAVLQIISMSVLTYFISNDKNKPVILRLLWLIVSYILWTRILLSLQFTTTAGIATLAGMAILLRDCRAKPFFAGGGLLFAGSLLRFHSAALTVLLLIPLVVWKYRLDIKKYIPFIIIGIVVIAAKCSDRLFYRNSDWQYYNEYNLVRGSINDANNAYNDAVYDNLPEGILNEDYTLFLYFLPDPDVMTIDVLKQIKTHISDVPMSARIGRMKYLKRYVTVLIILLLMLLSSTLADSLDRWKKLLFGIGMFLFLLLLMWYIAYFSELKYRVFFVMLSSMLMVVYSLQEKNLKNTFIVAFAVCSLLMATKYTKQIRGQRKHDRIVRNEWVNYQQSLILPLPKDAYVMSMGAGMHIELQSPWHIKDFYPKKYGRGWMTAIPFNRSIVWSNADLINANIYILRAKDKQDAMLTGLLQKTMVAHYGIETNISVYAENEYYELLQFSKSSE